MLVVSHAVLLQRRHGSLVGVVANVVSTGATAVKLGDQALIGRLGCDGLEYALGHGRPTDIAEADKEHRDRFRHSADGFGNRIRKGAVKRVKRLVGASAP